MANIIGMVITVLYWLLIARMVISFVPKLRFNPIGEMIYNVTEPILAPIRGIIPPIGGLDFSPMLLFFGLSFLQRALI